MPRCAAYLSGPRPCACCPLKSSSVVSCRHSTTDCIAILCVVCCQCGSRMARQSTFALSKKRYAAIVSLHPLHALGTLAVGVAAILSISVLARRFRRASPRSSCPNSVAVHAVDLLAICAVQKTRVNLKRPQFTRGAGKSLNVKDFFRASDAGYRLVYNEVGLYTLFPIAVRRPRWWYGERMPGQEGGRDAELLGNEMAYLKKKLPCCWSFQS